MKSHRAVLLLGFAALCGMALFVSRSDAKPETVRRVVPGVWFREGDLDQGQCNNVIIEMKDYMIVVDANYPSGAHATIEDVKRLSNKPVKYVFDTHHHGDHLYGNVVWTEGGATTLAFQGVAQELKRLEPARWLAAAKTRPDVAETHRDAPEPPNGARHQAGYQVDKVQRGDQPDDFKPMPAVGNGVKEIRISDSRGAYRVLYVARRAEAVYVLQAFQKKTQSTSRNDLEIAKRRSKQLLGGRI